MQRTNSQAWAILPGVKIDHMRAGGVSETQV
jgi:hypothetical protein